MKQYMCDFETSTESWLALDNGTARVWAGCCCTIEEQPQIKFIVNNIDDFMSNLFKLGRIECYFHNLKFDGEYIVNWLFHNGYVYDEYGKTEKSFSCVISSDGAWYEIEIVHKVLNKRYVKTTIYDSLKKLPMPVSRIAKSFNLPESKGIIDYDAYRPIGYELTDEEKEYITNDCLIVAKALFIQFSKGLKKMTIGSDALTYFRNDMGGRKAFKYVFPVLPLEVDNDIRKAYKGGFTAVNPKYAGKIIQGGISFDVNSLYPSVMYGNMGTLPYGIPKKFKGEYVYDKKYPLYIIKLSCAFKVKKNMIPTIQMKNNIFFKSTEYIKDSGGIVDLTLTSVDFELMKEHYNLSNVEFYGGYKFKETNLIFRDYIDYWMQIKATSTGGQRQLAKLMLNSLYGKFATNPKRVNKQPYLDKTENIVKYEMTDPEFQDPVYTALGAFITSRARAFTISNAQALYDYWVYSDTDSMYLTGISEEDASKYIKIHPTELGAWKLEHHIIEGKWLRAKTYIMESVEDGLTITCAGMPDNVKQSIIEMGKEQAFEKFRFGATFSGKLMPKKVSGGVILKNTSFKLVK